ncbi:MAG TPA: hypothetical protein VGF92_17880 [Stellaceae bacterium]
MAEKKKKLQCQRDRFIEAALEAGASEEGREFDEALERVAKQKPRDEPKRQAAR